MCAARTTKVSFFSISARTRHSNGVRRVSCQRSVVRRHRAAKEPMPFHTHAKRGAGGGLVGTSRTMDTPRRFSAQSGRSNKSEKWGRKSDAPPD
jgi:hypothetical protein